MKILVMEDDGQLVSEAWQVQLRATRTRCRYGTGVSSPTRIKPAPEPPVKALVVQSSTMVFDVSFNDIHNPQCCAI